MYKVIKQFRDLKDNDHIYFVGDIYPHNGAEVDAERIEELATDKNKIGVPLIEKVPGKKKKTKTDK